MVRQADELRACVKCSAPLTVPATGRPPRYCGTGCRRSAEYELRRLQRRIERLEGEATWIRTRPGTWDREHILPKVEAELADMNDRLRTLLDDDELRGDPK